MPGSTITEISPPTVAPTASGYRLEGDLFWSGPPTLIVADSSYSVALRVRVDTEFSVGPVPERVSDRILASCKIVLSNGDATRPDILLDHTARVRAASDSEFIDALDVAPPTVSLSGNGLVLVDDASGGSTFVLEPGDYVVEDVIEVRIADVSPDLLSPGVALEFGGLSSFAGFELQLASDPVSPVPASSRLGAAALGTSLLAIGAYGLHVRRTQRAPIGVDGIRSTP